MTQPTRHASAASAFGRHADLARKANLCSKVLAEGRRHVQLGRFESTLHQLVARAAELLEEMDELLVGFDPTSEWREFAMAASLHRDIESLQAAVTAARQKSGAAPRAADG
jgi:hypothetical protein